MMSVMSPVQSIFAGLKSVPLPLPLSLSTCSPAQVVGKAPLVRYPPLRDPSFGLGSRCSLLFFCGGVIACHTIADDGRRWLLACLEGILAEKVRQSGTGGRNAFEGLPLLSLGASIYDVRTERGRGRIKKHPKIGD